MWSDVEWNQKWIIRPPLKFQQFFIWINRDALICQNSDGNAFCWKKRGKIFVGKPRHRKLYSFGTQHANTLDEISFTSRNFTCVYSVSLIIVRLVQFNCPCRSVFHMQRSKFGNSGLSFPISGSDNEEFARCEWFVESLGSDSANVVEN